MVKIDTHVHTSEVSACAHFGAAETAEAYKKAGYGAIVITDHYCPEFFENLGSMAWEQKVERYLSGYHIAKATGEALGLNVLLGMEIRFTESWNDYLVYGFDIPFLLEHAALYQLGLARFHEEVIKPNPHLFLAQAHPFRGYITPADPAFLEGCEISNQNPRHDSHNHQAAAFAAAHGLVPLSGSDCHEAGDVGLGGIVAKAAPKEEEAFVSLLRSGDYQCIGEKGFSLP